LKAGESSLKPKGAHALRLKGKGKFGRKERKKKKKKKGENEAGPTSISLPEVQ